MKHRFNRSRIALAVALMAGFAMSATTSGAPHAIMPQTERIRY